MFPFLLVSVPNEVLWNLLICHGILLCIDVNTMKLKERCQHSVFFLGMCSNEMGGFVQSEYNHTSGMLRQTALAIWISSRTYTVHSSSYWPLFMMWHASTVSSLLLPITTDRRAGLFNLVTPHARFLNLRFLWCRWPGILLEVGVTHPADLGKTPITDGPHVSASSTPATSKASGTPLSLRGKGVLSANTPTYRWCWWLTSTQGISHTPVRRTHFSNAASRIRSCSESECRNVVIGEFCEFRITSFTSSVRTTRREGCTSSTVRLHHHSPL
jgi:hypothetical protein